MEGDISDKISEIETRIQTLIEANCKSASALDTALDATSCTLTKWTLYIVRLK